MTISARRDNPAVTAKNSKHGLYTKALDEVEAKTNAILKDKALVAKLDTDIVKYFRRVKKLFKGLDI